MADAEATVNTLAKRYAAISLTLKGYTDKGKAMRKERKDEVTPKLIAAMDQAGVSSISLAGHGVITLKTREKREKITPDVRSGVGRSAAKAASPRSP